MKKTSPRTVGRLSLYRFLLQSLAERGVPFVHSHDLALAAKCSSAQVRRDMMGIRYTGSPVHGYRVPELLESIESFLDTSHAGRVALVGVGNLGRAILMYFQDQRPKLSIVAAFDRDENKVGRVIHGCPCHHVSQMASIVKELNISVGIVAVPASGAQAVADLLNDVGITGLLNFAPVRLRLPRHVYCEDIDITISLEKVAYFSRLNLQAGR